MVECTENILLYIRMKIAQLSIIAFILTFTISLNDACFSKPKCDLRIGSDCYVYIDRPLTWSKAEECCVAWGGHLASIHSAAQNNQLNSIRNSKKSTWIGLTDIAKKGTYVWSDYTPYDYSIFAPGEPNNGGRGGNEFCIHIRPQDAIRPTWNDRECYSKEPYICQKRTCPHIEKSRCDLVMNGKCYIFQDYSATWDEAERCCVEWGGHLTSIHSDLENYAVNSIRDKRDYTWIGLSETEERGNYRWTDGTTFDYKNFAQSEPNRFAELESCIHFFDNGHGFSELTWSDYRCDKDKLNSIRTSYVCKKDYNSILNIRRQRSVLEPGQGGNFKVQF